MKRRRVLRGAAVLATPLVSGCEGQYVDDDPAGDDDPTDDDDPETETDGPTDTPSGVGTPDVAEWRHDTRGRVRATTDDLVVCKDATIEGGLFALDVETGDREWSYGETGPYSTYTDPTVDDGIYFGQGDDAIGSGVGDLYALEFDGTERWAIPMGSVYERPRVDDGVVYAGDDAGTVHAVDAATGETIWDTDAPGQAGATDVQVMAVDDAVYAGGELLHALEPATGDERWSYGDEDDAVRSATVVDGVAYVLTFAKVAAVEDGTELWSVDFSGGKSFVTVADETVVVYQRGDVRAYDTANGDERWRVARDVNSSVAAHGDTVYVIDEALEALTLTDGSERWREEVSTTDVDKTIQVVDRDDGQRDHAIFVRADATTLHRFDPDGTAAWSESVDEAINDFRVRGGVYVGTDEAVYALDPWDQ